MVGPAEGAEGLFVLSFAADGTRRFGRWFTTPHRPRYREQPHITAVTLGPRSEVTIAGVTAEAVDLGTGTIAPEEAAYDHTLAFVARYAPDGTPVRVTARKARSGTLPRLAAWADGGVVVAFDGQDGAPVLEAFDGDAFGMSEGRRIPAAISGRVDALAAAGPGEMVVATESRTEAEPHLAHLARVTRQGELTWSRTMRGWISLGALTVRANGEAWFAGGFEGPSGGCVPPSPMAEPEHADNLPRLQIVSADGTRCRSVPVTTRLANWEPPVSFVELPADHMLYATPCLGDLALPGLAPRSLGTFVTHCFIFDLPADSKEYTP
jgi:hypothetical protein